MVTVDADLLKRLAEKVIWKVIEKPLYHGKDNRKDWLAPPPLSAFTDLEPIGFGVFGEAYEDEQWLFHPDDCEPNLVWPLNASLICLRENDEIVMERGYTVTAKQVRGYASRISPFMVRTDIAQMDQGKLLTAAGIYSYLGGEWIDAQKRTMWEGRDYSSAIPDKTLALTEQEKQGPRLLSALALKQRYEWAVSLGFETTPTIRFATDPTGIKELFRLRDIPSGHDRREALMTWVGAHWRKDRNDPDMELYVRKHLRGARNFEWLGMRGCVLPSQYDLEARDRLIGKRAEMRAKGEDKRLRQRRKAEA